ncbi:MAG TPA: DUF58 domain-containing protein [Phycisphaerae bacterium]|nr:DUF58 domain-containing protein [Phycisphaerae bacterium]
MLSAAQYLRPDVIAKVARLDLRARFIVEGFLSGLHGSPFQGFSVEFSEHRKYERGDDLRLIDWAVYARTDRFFVKKFDAETNLESYLLVDTSASMNYPAPADALRAGRLSKLDYAICLAAALGWLMIHQQDAVGLARFDSRVRMFLPARSKRSQLTRIIGQLAAVQPSPDRADRGLPEALHAVADRVPKRSLMIVLSDFLADADATVRGLHHLRFRGHDVILFQVLDWAEVSFPFERPGTFMDPETGLRVTGEPDAVRAGYLRALRDWTDRLRREAAAVRADFAQVHTAMSFDRALMQYLIERQRRF